MVTNIKVYLLSDYWAAGTVQLKISFRRLRQRGKISDGRSRRRDRSSYTLSMQKVRVAQYPPKYIRPLHSVAQCTATVGVYFKSFGLSI